MKKSYGNSYDTNVVQSLFILKHRPDKVPYLEMHYSPQYVQEMHFLSKTLQRRTNLFVTPEVMKEIEKCESKLPGIVDFTRKYFHINVTTSQRMIDSIVELAEEYLKEDIYLSDGTRVAQSALIKEMKNGELDAADAHIVSGNNVVNGYPFFSLNEKHLITMQNSCRPNKPLRSFAVLKKNKYYLNKIGLHKVTRANLKKNTATTFRVDDINKNKGYLEVIMNENEL